jgi:hypothetical protein
MEYLESICTAHHEAAHAVIYLHFGIYVERITLARCGGGICSVSDELPASNGRLLAILAGPEADKVFLAGNSDALSNRKSGWKTDLERAAEVFGLLDRRDSIEDAIREAAVVVKENWRTICSLAEQLIHESEANFREDDPQYIMLGSDVKRHVERFLAGPKGASR